LVFNREPLDSAASRCLRADSTAADSTAVMREFFRGIRWSFGYVFNASFTDVSIVGNFVGNVVDRAFAGKVCDEVSEQDGTR
jgi:hypothetical protein